VPRDLLDGQGWGGRDGLAEFAEDRFEVFAQCRGDARGDQLHHAVIDLRLFPLQQHLNLGRTVADLLRISQGVRERYDFGVRRDAVKSAVLLREARLRAGLSQIGLAERSDKHRVEIGRYEAGVVAPSLDTLIDLIRACGFDISLELVPLGPLADDRLVELAHLSPERRLERMLKQLDRA